MTKLLLLSLALVCAICVQAPCTAEEVFQDPHRVFSIPLKLNLDTAIMLFDPGEMSQLAVKHRYDDTWSHCGFDDAKARREIGKYDPPTKGRDQFLRIRNGRLGLIEIYWERNPFPNLEAGFIANCQGLINPHHPGRILQPRINDTIGGYPALGMQVYSDEITTTMWYICAEKLGIDIVLTYAYKKGWPDPGFFTKIRQRIKFGPISTEAFK